jgi:hypothetical protein
MKHLLVWTLGLTARRMPQRIEGAKQPNIFNDLGRLAGFIWPFKRP